MKAPNIPVDWTPVGRPPGGWSEQATHSTSVRKNADERLEVFGIDRDGKLWQMWQTTPDGVWSNWTLLSEGPLGGLKHLIPTTMPGANFKGCLEVFAINQGGQLWQIRQQSPGGSWDGWLLYPIMHVGMTPIAMHLIDDDSIVIFAVDKDGALWHCRRTVTNDRGSNWVLLTTKPPCELHTSSICAIKDLDGSITFFAISRDGVLLYTKQTAINGLLNDWALINSPRPLKAISGQGGLDENLHIYLLDTDNTLWYAQQSVYSGHWSSWKLLSQMISGHLLNPPFHVITNADDIIQVFSGANDGELWHTQQKVVHAPWGYRQDLSYKPGSTYSSTLSLGKDFPVLLRQSSKHISPQRQASLRDRLSVKPNIEKGIYPFKGVELRRVDIEWLIAFHENEQALKQSSFQKGARLVGIDLRGAILRGVDLHGLFLKYVRFGLSPAERRTATIEQQELAATHLEGANLHSTHLEGADLCRSYLQGVDLKSACLKGSNLLSAHLEAADLRSTDLSDASLIEANLTEADLRRSHMERAKLIGATLDGAYLNWTHLERANLTGASLKWANLNSAYLQNANLNRADLYKARLVEAHLEGACFRVEAEWADLNGAYLEAADLRSVNLQWANLSGSHLEASDLKNGRLQNAKLYKVSLAQANLNKAHLEGTDLTYADMRGKIMHQRERDRIIKWVSNFPELLRPANLQGASFDAETTITNVLLGDAQFGFVTVADLNWNDANLSVVDWTKVITLGEERIIKTAKTRQERIKAYREAARAYRGLVLALRSNGLFLPASRYRIREQQLERFALFQERRYLAWFGSLLLDRIAGYGERPARTFIIYLAVVLIFAVGYFSVTNYLRFILPTNAERLGLLEAVVLSITSFHGRGFFQTSNGLGDLISVLTTIEAVIGLFIELNFIATFSRRFLGD